MSNFSGIRRYLGFSYAGPWQNFCIPGLQMQTNQVHDTETCMFLMNVEHFSTTCSNHYVSVNFCNLLAAILHFRWRSTPRNHANAQTVTADSGQCPWTYESSLVDENVACNREIKNRAYDFSLIPKMYFRFPRHHIDISGRDVTELYTAVNSAQSTGQCPQHFTPSPVCLDKDWW